MITAAPADGKWVRDGCGTSSKWTAEVRNACEIELFGSGCDIEFTTVVVTAAVVVIVVVEIIVIVVVTAAVVTAIIGGILKRM